MLLRQGVLLAGIGVFVGLPVGVLVQRLMQAVFPAQTGFDLMPLAIVVPLVLGVMLSASYWPARRAAGINVLRVLRSE